MTIASIGDATDTFAYKKSLARKRTFQNGRSFQKIKIELEKRNWNIFLTRPMKCLRSVSFYITLAALMIPFTTRKRARRIKALRAISVRLVSHWQAR